jgi:glycosyltransferase involved in cell wall biosynthesis
MKIALFTEVFLPKIDGVVTRLSRTVAELQRQGDQVLVFAPGEGVTEYCGAQVIGIPGNHFPLYPELKVAFPRASMRRHLLDFSPDVIHAADAVCLGAAAVYYADVLDLPLVASYHTRIPHYVHYYGIGFLEPLAWTLMRFRHGRAQVNLCTSSIMAQELADHRVPRVHLWPKAVDTEEFQPRFASPAMREWLSQGQPERPLLLYVGRISPEKSIEKLRPVLDAFPDLRLALVGGGPQQKRMREYFAGKNVFFAGYLKGRPLAEAMASVDALVLPSQTETLGLVLLEAMAAGTVVIGAKAGGIPDVIQDGETGFLFDPAQEESLTNVIGQLLANPAEAQTVRLRARRQTEEWNWAAATRELKAAYQKAIDTPRKPRPASQPFFERVVKRTAIGGLKLFLS